MNKQIIEKALYFLFFLIVAILAYWQVALLHNTLPNDNLDCYLPWRTFVTDCISNKTFPFWCPYQQTGFPIHADMRSVLSPEYWFCGLFLGIYTNYTLHLFFIFYVVVAGYGMHRLALYFGAGKMPSLIAGTAFMLSGFIVSQGQDISSVAGMAWLPFCLLFYLKLIDTNERINIIKTSIFLFLMVTGSYPAMTIILQYLFLSFFLIQAIKYLKSKNYIGIKQLVLNNIFLYLVVLTFCAFYIASYYYSQNYIDRFGGLNLQKLSHAPFTPQSSVSLLLPFATVKSLDFYATDVSLNSIYVGIIVLIFFIVSFFRKKSVNEIILLIFGVVSLLISFDEATPLRAITFHFPLMSMFRGTSFFRPFVMLPLIILASRSLTYFFDNPGYLKKKIVLTGCLLITIFLSFILYAIPNLKSTSFLFFPFATPFIETLLNSDIYGHIILQSAIQIGFISLAIFLILKYTSKRYFKLILSVTLCLDLVVSVQLNAYFTLVGHSDTFTIKQHIESQPRAFPIPALEPINKNVDSENGLSPLWRNTSIFTKTISPEGNNPFVLKNYCLVVDSFPKLYNKIISNPVIYFSHKLTTIDSIKSGKAVIEKTTIGFSKNDYNTLSKKIRDTLSKDYINIIEFSPNSIKTKVYTESPQLINFVQSNYACWKCFIDGQEQQIYTSNINYMSALVSTGEHTIEFRYQNLPVLISFYISYTVFILLIVTLLSFYLIKSFSIKCYIPIVLIVIIIATGIIAFLVSSSKTEMADIEYKNFIRKSTELNQKYGVGNILYMLNCDRTEIADSLRYVNDSVESHAIRLQNYSRLGEFSEIIRETNKKYIVYFSNKLKDPEETNIILKDNCYKITEEEVFETGRLCIFSKDSNITELTAYTEFMDFINSTKFWTVPPGLKYDTIHTFNNHKVLQVDSTNIYSNAFNTVTSQLDIPTSVKNICFTINCMTSDSLNSSYFVFKHKQPGCVLREWYFPLNSYLKSNNCWYKAIFCINVNLKKSDSETFQAFVWNPGGKKLLIGNATIQIY